MKARMKRLNIHLVDVPEEKNKEHEKVIFKETISKNFL